MVWSNHDCQMGKTPAPDALLGLPLPFLNPRDSPSVAEWLSGGGQEAHLPASFPPHAQNSALGPSLWLPYCLTPFNLPPPPPKERGRPFGQLTVNCLGTSFYKASLRSLHLDGDLSKHTHSWSCPLGGFPFMFHLVK